jgi:hypothetical protein
MMIFPASSAYHDILISAWHSSCPARRAGAADEVDNVAALLMGPDGTFITGCDF